MGSATSSNPNGKINPMGPLTAIGKKALKLDENDGATETIVPQTVSSLAQQQLRDSLESLQARVDSISEIRYADYEYPFENLVFEGGGAKGQVYIGCLQIMEEIGLKPKRVAGASAGAICAALVAAGYSSSELDEILSTDLEEVLIDHSCGVCSLLPNLIRRFGWNPGNKFLEAFGVLLAKKLGNPDITFLELYKKTGIELCVTAVCVNMLSVEYFHHKTTPKTKIRLAVRMSLSIPGVFEAVRVQNGRGQTDIYIDGGLLCNYPIHAFDGWWLSQKRGDSFLERLKPLNNLHSLMEKKERFGTYNDKTIGFLVYSSLEQDLLQQELNERVGVSAVERPPESKLYMSRADALESKEKTLLEHQVFLNALDKFMKTLRGVTSQQSDDEVDDYIDKAELKEAFKEALSIKYQPRGDEPDGNHEDYDPEEFTSAHVEILFGPNADIDKVFDDLDVDDNDAISFNELLLFIEKMGIDIQSKFQGYDRRELNSLAQFAIGLQDCLLTNVKKMYLGREDLKRTVGVNTDYIGTMDFKMEDVDRQFCIRQGRNATISYLKHYVHQNKPRLRVLTTEPLPSIPTASPVNGGIKRPSSSSTVSTPLPANAFLSQSSMATKETIIADSSNPLPPIRGKGADVTDNPRSLPPLRDSIPSTAQVLPSAQIQPKSKSSSAGLAANTRENDSSDESSSGSSNKN